MEIADGLRGLSLERYAETFRDNPFDVAVLPELSEADLERTRRPLRPSQDHAEGDRTASWRRGKTQVGDVVTMRTPRGTDELEIIAIRYDELP